MENLIGLVCLSLIFLATACVAVWNRPGTWQKWVAVAATILFGILVPLQAILTWVSAFLCLSVPARPRPAIFPWAAGVAMLLSYTVYLWNRVPNLRLAAELRKTYPLESLANRLDYEAAHHSHSETLFHELSADVRQRMKDFEDKTLDQRDHRKYLLEGLHDGTRDQFTLSPGFGVSRVLPLTSYPRRLELPDAPRLPVCPDGLPPATPDMPASPTATDSLLTLHESGRDDFVETARMAYIRNLDQVAGFKPHRFSHPVPKMRSQTESAYWQVVRLELISLLKHENPVAYQSTFLPRMDELQSVPVRPLEDFEQQALTKLRTDEDVVIIETGDRIQMVGSLRAAQSCLECHRVQHGELLGAFTYELRPSGSLHP